MVAVANRAGAQFLEIAARARLGHRNRADRLARDHPGEPFALELVRTPGPDIRRDHFGMDHKAGPAHPGFGQFLDNRDIVEPVGPVAAEFLGHIGTQQPGLARLAPHFARHALLLFPIGMLRNQLGLDERRHGIAKASCSGANRVRLMRLGLRKRRPGQ